MPVNITKAIMTTMPTANLYSYFASSEIKLIVKHEHIIRVNFVKPSNVCNREARFVHKALRLYKNNLFGLKLPLTY